MTTSQPGPVRPVPERLHTVTPRLVVADGGAAIAFYAQAFGAEEVGERFTGPGGELIHAEIRIGDSVVMITEDAVDGPVSSPGRLGGMVTCVMSLYWEDVDAAWQCAVAAGPSPRPTHPRCAGSSSTAGQTGHAAGRRARRRTDPPTGTSPPPRRPPRTATPHPRPPNTATSHR